MFRWCHLADIAVAGTNGGSASSCSGAAAVKVGAILKGTQKKFILWGLSLWFFATIYLTQRSTTADCD